MKLGFVTAILPDLKLPEILQFAGQEGYDCVEVMCWPVSKAERRYAGVTHIEVGQLSDANVQQIRQQCDDHRVALSGLGYYPNLLTPQRAEAQAGADHLRRVVEAAAKLGLGRVNTFVGRDWTASLDDNWPRFVETWRPLVGFAEQHAVRIGIENCPMFFSRDEWPGGKNLAISPAIWRRMFAEIPNEHWGLNYDPSHMIWQHMDYLKPLREFSARLVHVHAKDVRIDRARLDEVGILAHPLEYHTPKLPGMGDVDWGKFFSVLTDVGYNGPVCVEVEDRAYEADLASRQAALRQSLTFLRNFIPRRD